MFSQNKETFHEIKEIQQISSKDAFVSSNNNKKSENEIDINQKEKEEDNKNQKNTKNQTIKDYLEGTYNSRSRMRAYDRYNRWKMTIKKEKRNISNKKENKEKEIIKNSTEKKEEIKIVKEPIIFQEELNISEKEISKPKIEKNNELNDEPIIYKHSSNYLETGNQINETDINNVQNKKLPLKWKIIIIISSIIILLLIIFLIIYFKLILPSSPNTILSSSLPPSSPYSPSPSSSSEEEQPDLKINYFKEDLVSDLTYKENQIMRFQNIKTTNIIFDFYNITTNNNSKKLIEYFDYVIGIVDQDKVIDNFTEKETFSGFIFLENYLIDNETDKMLLQTSDILKENENNSNIRNLEDKTYFNFSLYEIKTFCCIDNETLPLMKFAFYRNGKISRIYKPKSLSSFFYDQMIDIIEKIIPKISRSDFNDTYNNISEALEIEYEKIRNRAKEEINDDYDDYDDLFEEEKETEIEHELTMNEEENSFNSGSQNKEDEDDFIDEEENNDRRRLSENATKTKKIKHRKLEINNIGNTTIPNFFYNSDIIEQTNNFDSSDIFDISDEIKFIDNTDEEPEINDNISQIYNIEDDFNINLVNNEETNEKNISNNTYLNYYGHSLVRNEYLELKGSQQNTTINTRIDENEKVLKEVHYIHKGLLVNDTKFRQEIEKEKQQSCSNDSFMDCNDLINDKQENIVDSKIKSINYEIIEDIILIKNYIDYDKTIINKLNNAFIQYGNDSEITENNERLNSSGRFLRDLTEYIVANKFEYSDIEIKIEKKNPKRHLDDFTEYYGMKNMEYSKSLFHLNLIGIQMKLEIINTMIVKEGKAVIKIKLQFAFIKISITLKTLQTNMHLAIRNYNEMGFTELYLINESNNKLINQTDKYCDIILNLEKDFNSLLVNKHDFSNIFKESFNEMYEQIKNFTTIIFQEFIQIIRNAYDNYTEVLEDVNENKHEVFNEIRKIIKYEYINFIYSMLVLVEEFNNKTFIFLFEVSEEVSRIDNFQIDLLYDLIDIVYEAKKIFKDFNKNLFLAIEKGIKAFKLDFNDFIHDMMGDLLYLIDFLSINLNKNDILRNGMDDLIREELTIKLKNIRNIINVIVDNLKKNIELDYKEEINERNINSIKVYSETKLKEYLENLEYRSENIIIDIKNKIVFINLYELYADNMDKIEEITNEVNEVYFSDIYNDTLEKVKNMEPEYLKENSKLLKNREKLINIVDLIDQNIDEEIKEINEYIYNYTNDFKNRRQYFLYYNYYNFMKSFIDSSLENLRNNFIKLINDTVLISIRNTLNYNYNLGCEYLNELVKAFKSINKRDEMLQTSFWTKYSSFIKTFQEYLPNCYSDKSIEVYKQYYNKIRNDIIDKIISNMSEINYYYFNISIYQEDFYFIFQINNKIEYLKNKFEQYFNEEYFNTYLANYIYRFTSENLNPLNDQLYKQFENLRKQVEKVSDGTRKKNKGDYCYNNGKTFHHWHYRSVQHTNNYKYLDKTFTEATNFIQNGTNIIINEFIGGFSSFLSSYVIEIKTLFDELYNYTEKKLNSNQEINILTNEYNSILNNMSNIADDNDEKEIGGKNINYFGQNLKNKILDIQNVFFENYYLKNFSSFLEYPDEILYKISNLEKELTFSSEIVQKQINYIIQKKILRNKKENHYFIYKTKDILNQLIKIKVKNKQIFNDYKYYRINNNLNTLLGQYNYTNNDNDGVILNENDYNNTINNIIQDYKNIILKIEKRINEDWILENCTEIIIMNVSDETNGIFESDYNYETDLICYKYKNKSSLNYSDYNFNVVKIRRAIYYIKYLYENLESLFNEFNFDILMNSSKIKYKDDIVNDKNIFNIYEKTEEKLKVINQEAEELLEEYYNYFEEDINETIMNELDFKENLEKFGSILNFTEENFLFEINKIINESTFKFFVLLNEYNETLIEQINLIKIYEKHNFNYSIFKNETDNILESIIFNFNMTENKIKNISNDYLLNNTLKIKLENLYGERAKYTKKKIEDFNKNYEIKPFNLTFNIGEKTETIIKHLYENMMFNFIKDYIELFELNGNIFSDSLLEIINIKKEEIVNKYNEITNEFYDELNRYSEEYIDDNYIKEYFNNYTNCLNYSIDELNETLIKDEKNYNKYVIHNNKIEICSKMKEREYNLSYEDIIGLNITNSSIIELIENLKDSNTDTDYDYFDNSIDYNNTEKEDIIDELNNYLDNFCNDIFNQKINFINETEILIDCSNNNWYNNYINISFFNNFNEEILTNLKVISSKYNEIINSFYLGGEFILKYLLYNDYIQLNKSENLSEKQIRYNLENFQDMADYINYRYEKKYNELLKEELIKAFNESFKEFTENIISGDIEDNILIYIFGKIDIYIEYIKAKVKSEDGYYIFLLNKTEELGITSKNALLSLYDYINDRVNKTVFYQIEDYISDNIIFFYRENKYLFKDFFIYYFIQNKNKIFGSENIFNLKSFLPELIYSKDFNKTLENISKEFLEKLLIKNIYNKIPNQLNLIVNNLSLLLQEEQTKIELELKKIKIVELYESMLVLAKMINNYTDLVNKQNNRFKFIVSNSPLEKFKFFSENYLEPPLDKIKEYYDMIQTELLKKISEIVDQMRDVFGEIKTEYNITEQMNNMYNVFENTYEYLVNYSQTFIDDIDSYDDILLLYTYLGENEGIYNLRALNEYIRSEERDLVKLRKIYNLTNNKNMNNKLKRLAENDVEYYHKSKNKSSNGQNFYNNNLKIKKNNVNLDHNSFSKVSFNNKRKLSSNPDKGSVSISTIAKETETFIKTLKNFNRTYLTGEYLKIRINWFKEENRIKKYLINSRRSIELSVLKLASIITEDKMDSLEEILFFKHNQISDHVNNYMNLIPPQIDNYIYLIENSSEILDKTYEEVKNKILLDYYVLKELIIGQIQENKKGNKNEIVEAKGKVYDFFKNEDIYRPIGINILNNTEKNINLEKSKTIIKNQKILKYSKYCVFNDTNQKYDNIQNILEEAKMSLKDKRRLTEAQTPTQPQPQEQNNNPNGKKDEQTNKDKEQAELKEEFDLMKGKLSYNFELCKEIDFADKIKKKFPLFSEPIPIIGPLKLVLDPKIILGFCIGYEFETKLYDNILDTDKIFKEISNVKEKDKDEDENKFAKKVVGKGEASMDIAVGIVEPDKGPIKISFLAGINGLLGSGEIGFSLGINLKNLGIDVDSFFTIQACVINVFLKLEIEIDIEFYKLEFEFFIFNIKLFGIKYEQHNIIRKMITELIFDKINYLTNK